jgi:hypothetical protein
VIQSEVRWKNTSDSRILTFRIGADLSAEQHDAAIVPRNTKRVKFSEGGQPGEVCFSSAQWHRKVVFRGRLG